MRREGGFTLVEMLLSVTIISILVGASLPVYESFVRRNDLDLTTQSVVALIRRAEAYARTMYGDTAWSVELQPSTVTLFAGTNFAGRNTGLDETMSVPASIALSGLGEIQFTKLSAVPNTTGTVTLSSTTNDTRTISVNAKGMVDY